MCLFILGCNSTIQYENKYKDDQVIFINRKIDKKEYLSTNIRIHRMIQLETTEESTYRHLDKLIMTNGYIYILDSRGDEAVYIFDLKGKFIRKIAHHGKGKGDFATSLDMEIGADQSVSIYSAVGRKIVKYSFEDEFMAEFSLYRPVRHFMTISEGRFLYEKPNPRTQFHMGIQTKSEILKEFVKMSDDTRKQLKIIETTCEYGFKKHKDKIYISPYKTTDIYEIIDNTHRLRYHVDIGGFDLYYTDFDENGLVEPKDLNQNVEKFDFFESDNHLLLRYKLRNFWYEWAVYDKEKKVVDTFGFTMSGHESSLKNFTSIVVAGTLSNDEGQFISSLPIEDIDFIKKWWSEFSTAEKKGLCDDITEMESVLENYDMYNNNIILTYSIN